MDDTYPECYLCGHSGMTSEYGELKLQVDLEFKDGHKDEWFHDQCLIEWTAFFKGTDKE